MREKSINAGTKFRDMPLRGLNRVEEIVDQTKSILDSSKFLAPATSAKYGDFNFFDRPTFSEDYNSVISNPVYIIEFLLRRYTNIEIDIAKFDEIAQHPLIQSINYSFSLNKEISLITLINELLFPFFGILYKDAGKWRINTLWIKDVVGTITDCLKQYGEKKIKVYFDYDLYSSFIFRDMVNYAMNEYQDVYVINRNHSDIQFIGIYADQICAYIEDNFKIKRTFEYNYKYGDHCYSFMRPMFEYYTTIKMIVEIDLPLKDAIRYELGDYVRINIPDIIPASYNNTKDFIVIGKEVNLQLKPLDPFVRLQLMSSPFSGYLG